MVANKYRPYDQFTLVDSRINRAESIVNLLQFNGHSRWVSVLGALIGSSIGIFSREALLSHGVVYWSHSLYQPILVLSLYFIFKYLTSESKKAHIVYSTAIIIVTFLGPLVEWTSYVFNSGLFILLWLNSRDSALSRKLAIQILIVTVFAGVLTVAHVSLAIGFTPAIEGFLGRFLARNTSVGSIAELIQGYGLSYGLFIAMILTILSLSYFTQLRPQKVYDNIRENINRITLFVFVAACAPLLENIIMLQHATQFSFDRLKFIFPASLILAFAFARYHTYGRVVILIVILLSSFQGYKSYKVDMNN